MTEAWAGRQALGGEAMIRIAITVEAFEAIAATIPLGSVGYEAQRHRDGLLPLGAWRRGRVWPHHYCPAGPQ